MKLGISLITLIILVVAIGILADWWLGPVKEYAGLNSNAIQGIAGYVEILLAIGAVLTAIWGFWPNKKKKERQKEQPVQINQTLSGGSGDIQGISQNATVITGQGHQIYIDKKHKRDRTALRTAYLNHLFENSRLLSLTGVDPKAASEVEARLELESVYTALLTQSSDAYEAWQRGGMLDKEKQRLSAVEQLNRESRLVLLGDPGSGKSTFVNFVALCLAGEALEKKEANLSVLKAPLPLEKADDDETKNEVKPQPWNHGVLIPVRVILRDFAARGLPEIGVSATANHLWNFIENELKSASLGDFAEFLYQELLKKGGILLIDGLDEVPEADQRRVQIKQAVEDFAATFHRCRILVTSRIYAYHKQDWRLNGFQETVLAPFTTGQINYFVDGWYRYVAKVRGLHVDEAQGRAELLKRAIDRSNSLQGLAERPLLLTLMASLHAWRGGTLPEHREKLYDETVELLLDRWERPKMVRELDGSFRLLQPSLAEWLQVDKEKIRKFLNSLAYTVHASQPELVGTADIGQYDLVCGLIDLTADKKLNTALLIDFLSQRAGLLIPRGNKIYTFPHRTFQEYLAACYLTDHDYPDHLADLVLAEPERWREVALLAGAKAARGSASSIWLLVEALCHQPLPEKIIELKPVWGALLAGQALAEAADLTNVNDRNRPKLECVKKCLISTLRLNEFPATERAAAGAVLGKIGDTRNEVLDVDYLKFCFVPAGPFWMGIDKNDEIRKQAEKAGWFFFEDLYETPMPHDFWISQFPITNAQFQQFVNEGYLDDRWWTTNGIQWRGDKEQPAKYGGVFDLPNHPVVVVSWYEALAFTRWLTHYYHEKGWLKPDWQITLPSEAEWEKAARGGLEFPKPPMIHFIQELEVPKNINMVQNSTPQRLYPWGDEMDPNLGNYVETKIGSTSAVGCFPNGQSPYGSEELSGNVWEWTRSLWGKESQKPDFHFPYDTTNGRENLDAPDKMARVVRGGAFGYNQGLRSLLFPSQARSRLLELLVGISCGAVPIYR